MLSFGIPVSSCFAGFLLCGGSFQPSGIMLPSGICQVLPASQRACKLYWKAGTAGFSLSPLYQLAKVLLSGFVRSVFCTHCDHRLCFCLFCAIQHTNLRGTWDKHIEPLKYTTWKIQESWPSEVKTTFRKVPFDT